MTMDVRRLTEQPSLQEVVSILLVSLVVSLYLTKRSRKQTRPSDSRSGGRGHDISIFKTQIIKCNISHHRLFPASHRFAYSYLSVGIPVLSPTSSWLLSVDVDSWWKRGWLHVTAKDHLCNRRDGESLRESLENYLRQQGLDAAAFPYVYLLTSPRFLNYKFSPASFWYLYTADTKLAFVIAEVNNTFDERRMYLFPAPQQLKSAQPTCSKDFHVSPFNSRKGLYALYTKDPAHGESVSVTITLRSSKGHPKMVARLWSIDSTLDPSDHSFLFALWFLVSWGWVALASFPRILFQATLLAHYHKLSIWYRPEPRESAIPRRASKPEALVASCFDLYLSHILQTIPSAKIRNTDGASSMTQQRMISFDAGLPHSGIVSTHLELRIHTAQFYRQIITYGNMADFLSYTLLHSSEENHTAWSNDAEGLVLSLKKFEEYSDAHQDLQRVLYPSRALSFMWAIHGHFHITKPLQGAYPFPGSPQTRASRPEDLSGPELQTHDGAKCFLDTFVRYHCNRSLQMRYMYSTLYLQWRSKVMGMIGGE